MRSTIFLSIFLSVALFVGAAAGQTTVQLPTFHVFGASTTVMVPDRGSVYLGGVDRSLAGSSRFSPTLGGQLPSLHNRGFGRERTAAGLAVSATIIDHQAIDRALLAEADRRRRERAIVPTQKLAVASGSGPAAEAQRVGTYLRRAQQAEIDGQPQMAKIFYERVARHGNASERKLANERLAHFKSGKKLDQ